MNNGKPCGQGKPYKVYTTNQSFREGKAKEKPREYKSGGIVYTDKNDEDTKEDMKNEERI